MGMLRLIQFWGVNRIWCETDLLEKGKPPWACGRQDKTRFHRRALFPAAQRTRNVMRPLERS